MNEVCNYNWQRGDRLVAVCDYHSEVDMIRYKKGKKVTFYRYVFLSHNCKFPFFQTTTGLLLECSHFKITENCKELKEALN